LAFTTLAVCVIVIVTGRGPQSKVTTPPAPTAVTTASEAQLSGVPFPMTVVGREVSSACASGGTGARPSGLPACIGATGAESDVDGIVVAVASVDEIAGASPGSAEQPVAATRIARTATTRCPARTRRC
jgi:hypothetical protein